MLLDEGEPGVLESNTRVKAGHHSAADGPEILGVERAVMEDEGVKAEIAKLELPEGTVVVSDPWIYGLNLPGRNLSYRIKCLSYQSIRLRWH